MIDKPLFSLVVATKGRSRPLWRLFESLERQDFRSFEVVVVDQNDDLRVGNLAEEKWCFPITHMRMPGDRGLSRGRNEGFRRAQGQIMLFPDDDCWYPPWFLSRAADRMASLEADVLSGRACDEEGRSINGRYEPRLSAVDRKNVWTTGIEWVVFIRRPVLAHIGGYSTALGVGAATPWQSCEGQDVTLRALKAGYSCVFDPSLFGHHAELDINDSAAAVKARSYARGFGYVMRIHAYPLWTICWWVLRPAIGCGLAFLRGEFLRSSYYCNVALGRLEGFAKSTL